MKSWFFLRHLAFLAVAILAISLLVTRTGGSIMDYSAFKDKIRSGAIQRVQMDEEFLVGFADKKQDGAHAGSGVFKAVPVEDPGLVRLMDSMQVDYAAKSAAGKSLHGIFFNWVLPALLLLGLLRFFLPRLGDAGQGILSLGKSRAHAVSENAVGVTFDDVAGVDEAKEELTEVIDFLKHPAKYAAVGGRIPRGVMLVGPPGTGKTLLARAVAGEARVPFFQISGAEFVEMIVGVGAARVRDMFKEAREKSPSIIFIDEIDAIGRSRSASLVSNDEREQTLNQLLVELQGFDAQTGVIVLAATNRPDVLDPALLRPGRFDRYILVDRPDLEGRKAILEKHARKVAMDVSVDLHKVAQKTPGFVGADLANIVNESALLAVRAGRDKVLPQDLEEAIEKNVSGLKKKNRLISPREKEIVAYHEIGHALVAEFTPKADRVEKISIVPRGFGALGFTMQLPTEERFLITEPELIAKVDVLLGGRMAEKLVFREISTGAANDLAQSTEIARQMIVEYGMSEKYRDVVLRVTRTDPIKHGYYEPGFQREYAETTQQYIDDQIAALIRARAAKVAVLLEDKLPLLHLAAKELMRVETLSGERFRELLKGTPAPSAKPFPTEMISKEAL